MARSGSSCRRSSASSAFAWRTVRPITSTARRARRGRCGRCSDSHFLLCIALLFVILRRMALLGKRLILFLAFLGMLPALGALPTPSPGESWGYAELRQLLSAREETDHPIQ